MNNTTMRNRVTAILERGVKASEIAKQANMKHSNFNCWLHENKEMRVDTLNRVNDAIEAIKRNIAEI
ncbi:hypothetical protein NE261_01770 [Enterococcus italicus]|uniref:hypothetical protein n=1 Tax=Enterococcus italicus TaxID=246144 RepID=UPI002072B2DF|nr:hypothetical protein [Enterococcus italicus]MCM6930544.1 hypothetical protein [Enterococcus italicus]